MHPHKFLLTFCISSTIYKLSYDSIDKMNVNCVVISLSAFFNLLIKLKGSFFDTAVGSCPNFARM